MKWFDMSDDSGRNPQYQKNEPLIETDCCSDPYEQFKAWYDQACRQEIHRAKHMVLGTVSAQGHCEQRVVLLQSYSPTAYLFYTNYRSQKAESIMHQADVSLLFWWPESERQVRIHGVASKTSAKQSDAYFSKRARVSQLAAVASPQSKAIPDRETLDQMYAKKDHYYAGQDTIPCPIDWGGYQVKPYYYEFWQGGFARLHDRIVYQSTADGWDMSRLAP